MGPFTRNVVNASVDHRQRIDGGPRGGSCAWGGFRCERVEAGWGRAWRFDDAAYMKIKRMLEQGLDAEELANGAGS